MPSCLGSILLMAANITTWGPQAQAYFSSGQCHAEICLVSEHHRTGERVDTMRRQLKAGGWCSQVKAAEATQQGGGRGGVAILWKEGLPMSGLEKAGAAKAEGSAVTSSCA